MAIGITETVSVKSKPAIVAFAEGISAGAGPVADPLFIVGFYVASSALGAPAVSASGALVATAAETFLLPMGGTVAAAMGGVQNPRLQEALNQIYRWQDRIAGGVAGAVRYTQHTGRLVGEPGSDHLGKLSNSIGRLQNLLRYESLTPADRSLAQAVLNQLEAAKPR